MVLASAITLPTTTANINPWMQSKNMRETWIRASTASISAYQPSPLLRACAHALATPASLDPCCSAASREPEASSISKAIVMGRHAAALHRNHHC
jgi:hypothetical protein